MFLVHVSTCLQGNTRQSLSFCRGSRVEGNIFFFPNFFFGKGNNRCNQCLRNKYEEFKKQMAREHLLVVGWVGGGGGGGKGCNREKLRDIPICFRRITFITPRKPIPRTEHVT